MAVDFSNTSAPKPKAAPKPKPEPKVTREQQEQRDARAGSVKELGGLAQLGAVFKGWYADAGAISIHVPPMADKLAVEAETTPWLAKGLDTLTVVTPFLGLASIGLPLLLQLAVNHKRLAPEQLSTFGVVSPGILEAQAKTEIAKQAAEAIRAQRAAEAEFEQAQREIEAALSPAQPVQT